MTSRYELLIASIAETNQIIMSIFAAVLLVILAWHALSWAPAMFARPARIAFALWAFAIWGYLLVYPFLTVFSGQP